MPVLETEEIAIHFALFAQNIKNGAKPITVRYPGGDSFKPTVYLKQLSEKPKLIPKRYFGNKSVSKRALEVFDNYGRNIDFKLL